MFRILRGSHINYMDRGVGASYSVKSNSYRELAFEVELDTSSISLKTILTLFMFIQVVPKNIKVTTEKSTMRLHHMKV